MVNASASAKEYAVSTGGATGTTDAFIAKQRSVQNQLRATATASKTASLGMKALSLAANMLVIGLISKGIDLASEAISNYIHRVERANEAIDESRSSYEESVSSIDSMNSELQTTQEMVVGAGVDNSYFVKWQYDVNALRETVCEYVKLKHDTSAKDEDVYAARERIFPKWKTILEAGENTKEAKELHVTPYDVDSLVGYAEQFMPTSKGTMITFTTKQIFRKHVEALLGCRIAQNAVMSDSDRDTLQAYYSAQRRIQNCIDTASDLKTQKENYMSMKESAKDEPAFLAFIDRMIKGVEEQEKANEESRTKANEALAKVSKDAKAIEAKIKEIK